MIEVEVVQKTSLTADVCRLILAAKNGGVLPNYSAGAHIDVHLPGGLIRQYSLCAPLHSSHYEIAVLNEAESRGGSKAIHGLVNKGDTLTISEPKNHFPLADNAKKSLLFAGGIGITPMLLMAETLAANQENVELHYCAKTQNKAPFYERITQSEWASKAHFHFSQQGAHKRLDVTPLLTNPDPSTHLYVCGPNAFMDDILAKAKDLGWPDECLHREYFSAAEIDHEGDKAFEIMIKSSGEVLEVPIDCTILEVLEDNGHFIPVACEEGVCGTCVTGLLEGQADHKDVFLTSSEKSEMNKITPCCSRAISQRLVLDL